MASQETRISVRLHPGSPRNEIGELADGVLHVKVNAPPVKGKANRELIEFLSHALGISKSRVSIVKGQTGHHKVLLVYGLSREEIVARLASSRNGK